MWSSWPCVGAFLIYPRIRDLFLSVSSQKAILRENSTFDFKGHPFSAEDVKSKDDDSEPLSLLFCLMSTQSFVYTQI